MAATQRALSERSWEDSCWRQWPQLLQAPSMRGSSSRCPNRRPTAAASRSSRGNTTSPATSRTTRPRQWPRALGGNLSVRKLKFAVWGTVRAALVVGLILMAALGLGLGTAKAAFGERLLGFGAELSRWENLRLTTAPRR